MVNTLMTARGHNLISVRFRSESPHIAATVPLEALSDEQAAAGFLSVLRELAAGSVSVPPVAAGSVVGLWPLVVGHLVFGLWTRPFTPTCERVIL